MGLILVRHAVPNPNDPLIDPGLSPAGKLQANQLAVSLAGQPIDRILSSSANRCIQTVTPLAKARGLEIGHSPVLEEGELARGVELMRTLIGTNTVLSTHMDLVRWMIYEPRVQDMVPNAPLRPDAHHGRYWIVQDDGANFTSVEYIDPWARSARGL